MIGYAVQIEVWEEGKDPRYETVILSLDTDPDKPLVDLRLVDGSLIANASVDDLYEAVNEIQSQLYKWEREHPKEKIA